MDHLQQNYLRIAAVVYGPGLNAVRCYFDKCFPPNLLNIQLSTVLNSKLVSLKRKGFLSNAQWGILFPASGSTSSTVFDVSLMTLLLRHFHIKKAPAGGYDVLPPDQDQTPGADLARIKYYRNDLSHSQDGNIDDVIFKEVWTNLYGVVSRLGDTLLQQQCELLGRADLNMAYKSQCDELFRNMKGHESELYSRQDQLASDLIKQKENENIIRQFIEDVKTKNEEATRILQERIYNLEVGLKNMSDRLNSQLGPIPCNIKNKMVRQIKYWIDDDTKYVITAAAMSAFNLLQKHPCLTVSGNAGSGKTACIRHIALDLMARGYELVPVIEPRTIIDYHDESKKQVFILDDACGIHTVDQGKHSDWLDYGKIIQDCLAQSGSLLLVSVRLTVFNSELFQDIELLSKNVIGFKDEKYELSFKNRLDIFESYFKKTFKEFGIDDKTVLLHDSFPLLCRIFSSLHTVTESKNEKRDLVSFFKTPFKFIEDEVESMLKSAPASYCLLVLCVIFNGHLPKNDVFCTNKYKHVVEDCFSFCVLNTSTSIKLLTDIATVMTGVYLKDVDGEILFIHDIVMDVVSVSFGKRSPITLLKYADIDFIINRVKLEKFTKTSNLSNENTILIPESHHINFFKRLYMEIKRGNAWQVFSHCQLEHPEVQKQMIKYLKTKSHNDLRFIFFQVQDKKTDHHMQKLLLKQMDIWAQMVSNQPMRIENPVLLGLLVNTGFEWILGKGLSYLFIFVKKRLGREVYNELTKTDNICRFIAILGGNIRIYSRILSIQKSKPLWQNVSDTWFQNEYFKHDFLWAVITGQTDIIQHLRQIDYRKDCINECSSYKDIMIITLRLFGVSNNHLKMMMFILKIMKPSTILKFYFINKNVHFDLNRQLSYMKEMCEFFFTTDDCFNNLIIKKFKSEIQPVFSRDYLHREEQLLSAGFSLQPSRVDDLAFVFDIRTTYLEIASMLGHESVVNMLLLNGANPNELTSQTKNIARQYIALPITRTVVYGRLQVMKILLRHGAKIESTGPMGCTLLMLASSYGHYDLVKFLLDNEVDMNTKNIFQNTALFYASKKGHASIVDLLLDNGANVNTKCMRSSTPLIEAASWGHLEIVEKLLCRYSSVNACDDKNMNALTIAVENGHHKIVQKLLENKAAANIRTHKNETALMIACRKGNLNIVTILMQHIVDCSNNPTVLYEREHSTIENENRIAFSQLPFELCSNLTTEVNDDINQAFLNAYRNAHVAIMKLLLGNGANVQAQLHTSLTLLNNAVSKGEYIIVKLLLQNEAQVQKRANFGIPPLMLASSKGRKDFVKLLLKHGSSINSSSEYIPIYFTSLELIWIQQNRKKSEFKRIIAETDKSGTALIRAIQSGSPYELIKTLVQEKNIKINSQTYMGRTALMVACGSCQQKVVQLLLFYKANVSIKSKLGATALDIASVRELENENMIKDLLENGAIYSKDMIPYQEGYQERPVRTLFSKIELDIWIISLIIILGLLTLNIYLRD